MNQKIKMAPNQQNAPNKPGDIYKVKKSYRKGICYKKKKKMTTHGHTREMFEIKLKKIELYPRNITLDESTCDV